MTRWILSYLMFTNMGHIINYFKNVFEYLRKIWGRKIVRWNVTEMVRLGDYFTNFRVFPGENQKKLVSTIKLNKKFLLKHFCRSIFELFKHFLYTSLVTSYHKKFPAQQIWKSKIKKNSQPKMLYFVARFLFNT